MGISIPLNIGPMLGSSGKHAVKAQSVCGSGVLCDPTSVFKRVAAADARPGPDGDERSDGRTRRVPHDGARETLRVLDAAPCQILVHGHAL